MMEEVQAHFEAGEFDAAETLLRAMLEENPMHAEALFTLSRVRERQGDPDAALELMQSAIQAEPFNPNLHHALGVLLVDRKDLDAAHQAFERGIEIDPTFVNGLSGMAFVELARGRFKAAEHSANLALTEQPEDVQALTYMGMAKLEQGEHQKAIGYLQEALRLDPQSITAQSQLGRAFLAAGNAAFAMQCFENALQASPQSAELLDYLACAQLHSGMHQQAAGNFRQALALGRSNAEIFSGLAKCELALGDQDQAEVLMRRAIALDPGNADLVTPFADYQLTRSNPAEALSMLENLPRGASERVHLLLARTHRELQDTEAAQRAVQEWVDTGRASVEAMLELVTLLRENGRQAAADEMLQELLDADEPPLAARIYQALQLVEQGETAGTQLLRQLLEEPELSKARKEGLRHTLAEAYHRLGQYTEAAELYLGMAGRTAEILGVIEQAPAGNREFVESEQAGEVIARWPEVPPADGRPRPVFIYSWPGSGRERLVTALAAHPGIMLVADRSDTQAGRRDLVSQPAGARDLTLMHEASLQLARGRYWKHLQKGGLEPDDRLTVDAMWLAAEMLPTLARLFPEATVLVIGRDPGDLLLAWLQGGFVEIDAMARICRQQTDLLQRCRELLPVEFVEIDYDELAADPAPALALLQEKLGLTPHAAVAERFAHTPAATGAKTGEWQHYAAALEAGLLAFNS